MKTQDDLNFLYYCQEGNFKLIKHLINELHYKPSNYIKNEALYYSLANRRYKTFDYLFSLFEKDFDISHNNGAIIESGFLSLNKGAKFFSNIDIHIQKNKDLFLQCFFKIVKSRNTEYTIKIIFDNILKYGTVSFLPDNISAVIINKPLENKLIKRKKILDLINLKSKMEIF